MNVNADNSALTDTSHNKITFSNTKKWNKGWHAV